MEVTISTAELLTTDGIPLKQSLRKAERRNKLRAFLLVFPLLLFIVVTFVMPIGDMLLMRSISPIGITKVTTIKRSKGKTRRKALSLFLLSALRRLCLSGIPSVVNNSAVEIVTSK